MPLLAASNALERAHSSRYADKGKRPIMPAVSWFESFFCSDEKCPNKNTDQ
jgi:hypothetical protein